MDELSDEINDDPLAETFRNEAAFRKLLKNRTFVDYLNTFLSLPVFAVRVLYRRDNGQFELEQPVSRTSHHLIEENILTWVRVDRCGMFLKTSICNEYRLCATLLEMSVCLKIEGYRAEDLSKFQSKYMTKVIDMQRLKGYMQGTIGDSLISFWLDAERFRRQVSPNCRRFVIKEIYAKYLIDGAIHELSYNLRESIISNLNALWEERDKRCDRPTIAPTVLVDAQKMVMESLKSYWIPKYVQHRLKRRGLIKNRWAKALSIQETLKKFAKKNKFADIVKQMKEKECEDSENVKKEETQDELEPIKADGKIFSTETSSEKKLQVHEMEQENDSNKNKEKINTKEILSTEKGKDSSNEKNENPSNEKKENMFMRVLQRKEGKYQDDSELITITESKKPDLKDLALFEPLFPQIVSDDKRTSRRRTYFEAVHKETNTEYEADNEDDVEHKNEAVVNEEEELKLIKLPLIKRLALTSKSFISIQMDLPRCPTRFQQPYSSSFMERNILNVRPEEYMFNCLTAALTTDQAAGQPLLEYLKNNSNKVAESNLKFWTASNDILSDCRRKTDTVIRQKQYNSLIHMHLSEYSESEVSLSTSSKQELCKLLPKDAGVTKLMDATNSIAMELLPEWDDFMKHDKRFFLKKTTKLKRKVTLLPSYQRRSLLPSAKKDLPTLEDFEDFSENDDEGGFDGTFPDKLENVQQRDMDAAAINSRRMWRAMELAISICKPKYVEIIPDAQETETWTTDESNSEDDDDDDENDEHVSHDKGDRVAGSLALKSLEYINEKADRLKKLEVLFNKRHHSLAHDYLGVNLLRDIDKDQTDEEYFKLEEAKIPVEIKKSNTPPRPRCFQDVFTDSIQFEHFKRYLTKEKEETPLLFWAAVENMRTTSRTAKARQGRTYGIVKRFFSPTANHGKDLKCNADIIKEIPYTDQVTPTMLFSAQACIVKMLEETWFAKYIMTFSDGGGATGITLLPIYGVVSCDDVTRKVKTKTRGLWRMFTRNVISFRRGIMNTEVLKGFEKFLELQHRLNVDIAVDNKNLDNGFPPRIVINNKLIHTDKLVADLNFWSEVCRYKEFADAVVLCAKLGNYTKDDELIVVKKAKTIVDCFLDSQIPPKVQVNINPDLAENVLQLVQNGIIERGLFHEAALSTFSTLIFFWKKFCLHRFLPVEKIPVPKKQVKMNRSAHIIAKQKMLKSNKPKKVSLPAEEDCTRLMFSLQLGLRIGLPKSIFKKRQASSTMMAALLSDEPLHNEILYPITEI